ncbi:MAG TPA: archaellin/type IV pilin N-terminal domain-containing protein [Candidatus Thermoplasmatota archaeon]|jgi:flagellin FlaB|nr:archaellin/type IV pilin N-terminal domain-containing protein [Candidatus Thermoplasmatota archaeon]
MTKRYMEKLVGKYCKIVTKEPGEERANVVSGILEDVDYKDGFILVDSSQGLGCLRIDTIIAIKPGKKHRPENTTIKEDEEAAVGIGTLIVFIAMILVAAVAASVIIQTAENLQQRAYAVGKQTIRDVSSGLQVIEVTGYTDVNKTKIQYLAIAISPRAGSLDIDLNRTLLYLKLNNFSVLSLNLALKVSSNGYTSIFHALDLGQLNGTNYGVISIHDRDDSIIKTNGMSATDQAIFMVNLSAVLSETGGLMPGEVLEGTLVPDFGGSGVFVAQAPMAFKYQVCEL